MERSFGRKIGVKLISRAEKDSIDGALSWGDMV
jgi:hypothetical protein